MSHTFKHGDTAFIFNSDLSGPVTIVTDVPYDGQKEIVVSGSDLAAFMYFLATDLWSESDKSFADRLEEVKAWGEEA